MWLLMVPWSEVRTERDSRVRVSSDLSVIIETELI